MMCKMYFSVVFLLSCIQVVLLQGTGSGTNGNLRLCIVEGRGSYKRASKYCPTLDDEKSGVECVIATDRLDCLRRISKGTVDFGAFEPEDLIAAQWAGVDVLVTNEIRNRASRPFARSVVAVVNRRILRDDDTSLESILRNRTLCNPVIEADDLHPLSDTLETYLESLITRRSCDAGLSMAENGIKATADFFGKSCRAGPWVQDVTRDAELKRKYPSLCEACASKHCTTKDVYWGEAGALACMAEEVGDVTWAEVTDVRRYFKTAKSSEFAYLCRDGTSQPLENNTTPCVWINKPWPVIVAKRKTAEAVIALTSILQDSAVIVDSTWKGAVAQLLNLHLALPAPLDPSQPPQDYISTAIGFREAYSQTGCTPSRHITICTISSEEHNKCDWFAEAANVFGVSPPLQCAKKQNERECMACVRDGECDVTVADSDWLVPAARDFTIRPILHEATPIIDKTSTVVAYVRKDSNINNIGGLRGKRANFPRFDGVAMHSVLHYLKEKEKSSCRSAMYDYFSEICAPGIEKMEVASDVKERFTKNCYKNGDDVEDGELQALRALVEGKTDVAFISRNTFNLYAAKQIEFPWAQKQVEITKVCPDESGKYCFIGWANVGHVYAKTNITAMRRHELINVFTKLDRLFGQHKNANMFSMYGTFNHKLNVLFHNYTKNLDTDDMYNRRPYNEIPLSFEKLNVTNICNVSELINFGTSVKPVLLSILLLFVSLRIVS